ncbi:MAG: hypothetical protein KUG78_20860 [Kangiellaceae bacterium]|nr:hypothetical protein [Kangiellaceae bacterium]
MYINISNTLPTRKFFYVSALLSFGLSIVLILSPGTEDDLSLAYSMFVGSFIFAGLGYFIMFGGTAREVVFGTTICPHCGENGWDIKQKLKITRIEHTNIGRCNICKEKGVISFLHSILLLIIVILWFITLLVTDSIWWSSGLFYLQCIAYIIYYGRYVPVRPQQDN